MAHLRAKESTDAYVAQGDVSHIHGHKYQLKEERFGASLPKGAPSHLFDEITTHKGAQGHTEHHAYVSPVHHSMHKQDDVFMGTRQVSADRLAVLA